MLAKAPRTRPGQSHPLGATWDGVGVNFTLFSEHATGVELCLFHADDPRRETHRLAMPERTDQVWHVYLPEVRPGQLYGQGVHGPPSRCAARGAEHVRRAGLAPPALECLTRLGGHNAHHEAVEFVLPTHRARVCRELVLDTRAWEIGARTRVFRAGARCPLEGRSLALLRLTRPRGRP